MKKSLITLIVVIAAAAIGCAIYFLVRHKPHHVTYNTAVVERGSISNSITATGTIEPITQVEVGTQVSGIVNKIYVDYNSIVKKGQVIAELDKENLLNELASRKSNMNSAQSEFDYQQKLYNRVKELHDKHLASDEEYDQALYNYTRSKNSLEIAKVEVRKAQTNLGYATIYSPINGVVLSKAVEQGQTVASSFNTPTLFLIAEDLTQMRVVADVDEADIGGVAEGQRVSFTVDAYPQEIFNGKVVQVRQEATTTNNVVTYEVVINAPNDDLKLKPGLTASVTIYTVEHDSVLLVPAKALKFDPAAYIGPLDTIEDIKARQKVWTREGNKFIALEVMLGMSSGSHVEVIEGVTEGMRVITDATQGLMPGEEADGEQNTQTERSPFMPGPRKRK